MILPRRDWALIAMAAVLLTVAYPPFHFLLPAFVCLVPAAFLLLRGVEDTQPWRRHLHQGFWYGTVTHAVLLYWLAGSLWKVGGATAFLFPIIAVMFGGATAAVFVVMGQAVARSPKRLILVLPAGIVFLEWLAAQVGPIALPWHQLALTVVKSPLLLQTADIAGAGGTAFILALLNACLALAWWERRSRKSAMGHLEAAATVLFLMALYGQHRLQGLQMVPGARVAVVQPNVAAKEKWSYSTKDAVVERTARLAEWAARQHSPELVALPETALPGPVAEHGEWVGRLVELANGSRSTVVTGGLATEGTRQGPPRRYNAAFALDPQNPSVLPVIHRKQKLIPMTEWIPPRAPDVSPTRLGGLTPGRGVEVFDSRVGHLGTLLCYELTFADMARTLRRAGAEVLVTLSNDAWTGRTSAPYQHFAHASLRAVENRVSVVRAANTGVSGIVDPLGRVVAETHPFEETYAAGQLAYSGETPLAVHIGAFLGPLTGVLLAALAFLPVAPLRDGSHSPILDPGRRSADCTSFTGGARFRPPPHP